METQAGDTPPAGNDMEMLKKMEDEHLRLQRQVRMIQTDRKNRTMGVHPQFRRQDTHLRKLKKDYINLCKDLKIARSGAHKKKDKRMKQDLKEALLLRINTAQDAEDGITMMNQLEELLENDKQEMLLLKKVVTASQGEMAERRTQSEQRLVSTENQLEVATRRFDVLQAENRKIRDEIEHMLKDRALFNKSWTKMLTALNKGKKFLTDLFESSTLAYDQRDEWVAKLRSIQEKGRMDQMLQVQEMRELQKSYDHEMKLYHFLSAKGVMRVNKKQEEREEKERLQEIETIEKECDAHNAIIETINNYAKEENPEKIIKMFRQIEQQNFSMYLLMTEYCAEIEVLTRNVAKIRQDVVDRRDWNEMKVSKRQGKLQHMKEELEVKKSSNEALRSTLNERIQLMNRTMDKIADMFKFLDCSLEPYQSLLGGKGPSLWKFNLTMRLIMEKIQDIIQTIYFYERHVQKIGHKGGGRLKMYLVQCELPQQLTPLPTSLMVPADTCPSCVEARWLSRVTEAPETPLTKQEALQALATLQEDPAFVWSDRVHPLTDCRVPRSRLILAKRYMNM
ncbi:coiled-coil domain-containing protein 63-like [Plodia interpunctella]|uniref:coiled-coil domain-containing protein 63-like n=1 Tax=Plodia interpunctella TaxID=58824 RepID=UPI002368A4ED|nr:coiled-coil domain-containing protein 63-like [Plodia interpunctella]